MTGGADLASARHRHLSPVPPKVQRKAAHDLYRQRQLHRLQIYRLCRGVPGRLFLRGRKHAGFHPDECIDCGVCEPECPADAIRPDTEPDTEQWVEFNRKYSEMWPVIVTRKDPLPDAEERDGETGKLEKYFSESPGEGG